jgi:rubredoxin
MAYKIDTAQEIEREVYTEDDYRDMLNECYPEIDVCGYKYDPADALEQLDPVAFRCGFNDYQEYETKYLCPICQAEYDYEDEALDCCPENTIEDEEDEETEADE